MKEFLDKLQDFLFDILGLILPGLVMIFCLIAPVYLIDLSKIPKLEIDRSILLACLNWVSITLKHFSYNDYSFVLLLLIAYLIGHLVKVFSKVQYEIFEAVFDKCFNKIFGEIYKGIGRSFSRIIGAIDHRGWFFESTFYRTTKDLLAPIRDLVRKIFVFEPADYYRDNEKLKEESVALLNSKLNTTFPNAWYSLYKFSTVMALQENIKSLSGNFLAKYNLYRSLAFIFLFSFFYLIYITRAEPAYLYNGIATSKFFILLVIALSWFSFHVKYKRYWTLCGNETLISLFYFLNKDRIKK